MSVVSPAVTWRVPWPGVCAVAGLASLLVPATLGFDPWSWMVWSRELAHLELHTAGGPSWKPLPVLAVAPVARLDDVGPTLWLAMMRSAWVAALVLAFAVGRYTTGALVGGVVATWGVLLNADLGPATLRGSSEPLLVALVLGAVWLHLSGRRTSSLACLMLAGLLRPEVWGFAALYGAAAGVLGTSARRRVAGAALTLASPALWIGLDVLGSGGAIESSRVARTRPPGSAAATPFPMWTVLERAIDAATWPMVILASIGIVAAIRARERAPLVLAAAAVGWTAVVAALAQAGYTGRRRYLLVAAVLASPVAARGAMAILGRVGRGWPRLAVGVVGAIALAGLLAGVLRTDARLVSLAGRQHDQEQELRAAVTAAGGGRVLSRRGGLVVNFYLQPALAWLTHARLADVRHPAFSGPRDRYPLPAVVFRAPARLAGPRPALAPRTHRDLLARRGRWSVFAVERRVPRPHG